MLLPLRFRTEKTYVAAATLSHRKNICCCRYAFAQKKHMLLPLRFRTEKTYVAAASLSHGKTYVAAASLSHGKTYVAAATLSHRKTFAAAASLQGLLIPKESLQPHIAYVLKISAPTIDDELDSDNSYCYSNE